MSSQSAMPAKSAGPSVVLSDLSFSWPNGRRVLSRLSASFAPGRTGLIGVNGAGKSTVLRLIAGQLRPSSGSVTVTGDVGYLPQNLILDTSARVAELLGIADVLDAIGAIEAGDTSQAAFDIVGNDWDVTDRAREWLSRLGLAQVGLADPVGTAVRRRDDHDRADRRCSCDARRCCCSTSRPTTSTWRRGGGSTRRSSPGPVSC